MKSKKLPDILTLKEERALLSQFNTKYFVPHRNMLIIKLALCTGMRISELINLKFSDISLDKNVFRIHIKNGKGGKDRIIFISPDMYNSLYEMHEKHDVISKWVFCTHKKQQLQDSYLRNMIKAKGKKAGVDRVHFHLLRHTYLTRIYNKTNDIRLTQEIAGHSDISTTMIYTHTAASAVRDAMTGERYE